MYLDPIPYLPRLLHGLPHLHADLRVRQAALLTPPQTYVPVRVAQETALLFLPGIDVLGSSRLPTPLVLLGVALTSGRRGDLCPVPHRCNPNLHLPPSNKTCGRLLPLLHIQQRKGKCHFITIPAYRQSGGTGKVRGHLEC